MPRIGLISDTHGLLRPEAVASLRGSDLIIHAGDVGDATILAALVSLAPLTTVRGNGDTEPWAERLSETEIVAVGGISIYVLHDLAKLDLDPAAAGYRVVVCGHSHRPSAQERKGVLYINPGSAGPRRFKLPVTLAQIELDGDSVQARIIEIDGIRP